MAKGTAPGAIRDPVVDLLREISQKLDRLTAVTAAQDKSRDSQLEILMAGGCDSVLIGAVFGMHPGSVRKLQAQRRKSISDDTGLAAGTAGSQ